MAYTLALQAYDMIRERDIPIDEEDAKLHLTRLALALALTKRYRPSAKLFIETEFETAADWAQAIDSLGDNGMYVNTQL